MATSVSGFRKFAVRTSDIVGSSAAFTTSIVIICAWAISGPLFHYSDAWQLYINTGTTIVTFLMVFLIQNTQNRDALAMHMKLDELLRAIVEARTELVDLEDRSDDELQRVKQEMTEISAPLQAPTSVPTPPQP